MAEAEFYVRAIISCSIRIAIWLVVCTALTRCFVKAKVPAGYAYIPIVCESYMFRLAGKKNMFWFYFGFFVLEVVCAIPAGIAAYRIFATYMDSIIYQTNIWEDLMRPDSIMWMIILLLSLCGLSLGGTGMKVFKVFMCIGTCKNFGKGVGFMIGMILWYDLFSCILGFNKNTEYIGPPIPLRGKDVK